MITEEDLKEAIAECQGVRNPNASTCMKLAAYYIILNQMYPEEPFITGYSRAMPETVTVNSNSEFAEAVNGMDPGSAWALMDELMATLSVVNPRLYAGVMRKIHNRE